jgi:Icc-related predicted phosphoesterase
MSNEADRERAFHNIPGDTDILISHVPPLGILDGGQGCSALRRVVIRVKPKLHCFGHIHSAYGVQPTKNTLFVNAAILDEDGAPSRKPVLLNFSK